MSCVLAAYFLAQPLTHCRFSQPFQVLETNASSTSIVMGNVTVRNAPAFSPTSGPSSSSSFQVYVPSGVNIVTSVVSKTARSDGKTYFDISTAGLGGWDSNQWAPTATAPLSTAGQRRRSQSLR